MLTNIVAMLHTTAAYQAAALQLMVGQANFAARQLALDEPLPITIPADTNNWEVEPPPEGLGGYLSCSNYAFEFHHGHLQSIRKLDWLKKTSPPIDNVLELANRKSLLDTNSAYQLAKRWLAALSVNVSGLETSSPPNIFQLIARGRDVHGNRLPGNQDVLVVPLFMLGWGEDSVNARLRERLQASGRVLPRRPPSEFNPVFVKILGTTKELLELNVRNETLFQSPPLLLTNADQLLGPLPSPRHFVETMLGGKTAYETVAQPDKTEVWLLNSALTGERIIEKTNRTPAVNLTPAAAKQCSDILLNFDSYSWGVLKRCIPDYGVRLRFTRKEDTVEFLLCYECGIMQVSHNGKVQTAEISFDSVQNALIKITQSIFPNDDAIKKLIPNEN